jgi:hypothetical protein
LFGSSELLPGATFIKARLGEDEEINTCQRCGNKDGLPNQRYWVRVNNKVVYWCDSCITTTFNYRALSDEDVEHISTQLYDFEVI